MISRRKFVAGLGAGIVASPFINILNNKAIAQPRQGPRRLMVFFSPDGIVPQLWRPQGNENDFVFPENGFLAPLNDYRDDLLVLEGIDFLTGNNHEGGMAAMLTNGQGPVTNGRSVDQVIASHIGGQDRFSSMELGVLTDPWGASIQTRMSYSAPGQYVHPDADPRSVYRRMFGGVSQDAQVLENIRLRRRSVLDMITGDLNNLHQRLGQIERVKLERHLDAIRTVERGLFPDNDAACQTPPTPGRLNKDDYAAVPQLLRSQIDLAVTALACEMTKVTTIQLSHTVSPVVFSWVGNSDGHHALSHAPDNDVANIAQLTDAQQWCAGQFAYIIDQLRETPNPSGDGTLFDDTLLIWVKELGDSRAHVCESVPFVIAGSAGGAFRPGRYLRYNGVSHSRLLVSLCQAFGMEINSFGDPVTGPGALQGLS
ncbi:MAG: DUF1552 domain-containing protein [Bradymonadia bacterium]